MPQDKVSVLSLRSRTLVFLILLTVLSGVGVGLLWDSQERMSLASTQIQEVLLPTGRLIEQAQTEIDLQIQELTILHRALSESARPHEAETAPQDLARLRLPPGVRTLLSLQQGESFPRMLMPILKPWAELATGYETRVSQMHGFADAIPLLKDLRQRTLLLHRAIDRELSVQLLTVTQGGRDRLFWGFSGLLLAVLCALVFVFLVRVWMQPLVHLRRWTLDNTSNPRATLMSAAPPRSVVGGGILSPPAEVQSLVEALRHLMQKLQTQGQELESRTQKTAEHERSIGILFSALNHLQRHNEGLLKEVLKNERLASMGEMAAQLAHEIRNPLNSLNLKLELLGEELTPEQNTRLDRVLVEIDRLNALTESYLRTTRSLLKGGETPFGLTVASGKLDESVDSVLDTLKPELSGIFVQRSMRDGEIETSVPSNVLKAAVMNLVKNAAEALKGASDMKVIRIHHERDGTHGWKLVVSDTGCGMPREFLSTPIESFRTTKPNGSGLGLATCQNMLRSYGVEIKISSPVGIFATEVSLVMARPAEDMVDSESRAQP